MNDEWRFQRFFNITSHNTTEENWIFYHKCMVVLFVWGEPSTRKCICIVWDGTWKHVRNATVYDVQEWGLDSPSVFVPAITTYRSVATFSKVEGQGYHSWCGSSLQAGHFRVWTPLEMRLPLHTHPGWSWGQLSHLYNGCWVSSPVLKWLGHAVDHLPPSNAEFKHGRSTVPFCPFSGMLQGSFNFTLL